MYLTSTLFVIMSWVSFIIKPDVVPGRMGLLVTILLVLINIFNGAKSNAPKSLNLNAVDLYLVICIGQVFVVLVEYAIILCLKQRGVHVAPSSSYNTLDQDSATTMNEKIVTKKCEIDRQSTNNILDSISLILFPIFFIVFRKTFLVFF